MRTNEHKPEAAEFHLYITTKVGLVTLNGVFYNIFFPFRLRTA
jgi:hypothetical protein